MIKIKLLILGLTLSLSLTSQSVVNGTINHDGKERSYDLYLPSGYVDGGSELPLVFNFHGFGSNAFEQRLYSGMDVIADTANFLVCYPNGINNAWNVGWEFGSSEDDVGFVQKMIDEFVTVYSIDPTRVYACGMSNGGFFSYKLACDLPESIAAVASVTGSMVPGQDLVCNPALQTPVMEIHGTADAVVNYDGSPGISIAVDDVIEHWKTVNNCDDNVQNTYSYPDIDDSDGCTADRFEYTFCDQSTEVVLIRINGGGHTWPDALINVGVTNYDFNASSEIWNFFNKFQRGLGTNLEEYSHTDHDLMIAPNPSSGNMTIASESIINEIQIFSANFKMVKNLSLNQSSYTITNLASGAYFARINTANKIIIKSFVVL